MARVDTSNSPAGLSVADFMSVLNKFGGPAKQCRYLARIMPVGNNNRVTSMPDSSAILRDLVFLCDATEFPGRSFEVYETRYYGPTLALPYNTKYTQELSISFLTRHGVPSGAAPERKFFDDWLDIINPVNNFEFEYPKKYYCRIDIFQLSEFATESQTEPQRPRIEYLWSLHNAWPSTVTPQPVTWADNDVLRLSVSFIYQYWSRPGIDNISGSSVPTVFIPGLQQTGTGVQ